MMPKHNFCAGPAKLPDVVFQQASKAVVNYNESGLSILEISHRSNAFTAIIEEARALVLELLGLNTKDYVALFLHGGASAQFHQIPFNFLSKRAGYLNTGVWSQKAIHEARFFGEVVDIGSSKDQAFSYIPENIIQNRIDLDYIHYTSNNTIYGTQIKNFPEQKVPVVVDMSSDIFSRSLDFSQFQLIYAGAQKNIGAAGTTLVIINRKAFSQANRKIPSLLNYDYLILKESLANTPTVFSIYVSLLNLRWLKAQGGIKSVEKRNEVKANLLYNYLDASNLFTPLVKKNSRSNMNITFALNKPDLTADFDRFLERHNIIGLKGHRSVGDYRASLYNALELDSVKALVSYLQQFEENYENIKS